jgi:DNA-binding transcriptional ArsR family regulator
VVLPQGGEGSLVLNRRLWHLIAGTRGGVNRAKIIWLLHDRPANANSIAGHLGLDYKTVRHHLDVLRANDVVMSTGVGNGYATMYSLSPRLQTHFEEFLEIWSRFRGKIDNRPSPNP